VRRRGTKLLVVALLLNDGSGCRLVLVAVSGLVMILSSEGIGSRVGSVFSEVGSAALEMDEDGLAGEEKSEKIEAGLGACDNSAHPSRKDSTLPIVIQIRKANFNGFMMIPF
jgi:hypothetical protein